MPKKTAKPSKSTAKMVTVAAKPAKAQPAAKASTILSTAGGFQKISETHIRKTYR